MMYEMATIFDIYWTEIDSGRTKGAEKTGQRVNEWLMQQAGREGGREDEREHTFSSSLHLGGRVCPNNFSLVSTLYFLYYTFRIPAGV